MVNKVLLLTKISIFWAGVDYFYRFRGPWNEKNPALSYAENWIYIQITKYLFLIN